MSRVLSGRLILYLLILSVLDLTVVPLVRIGSCQPLLLYLIILYAVFQWGWHEAIPAAVAVGIFRDLTGSQSLGMETATLGLMAWGLNVLIQKIERDMFFLRLLITFLFVFLAVMFHLILSHFLIIASEISWRSVGIAFGTAVYTAAVMPIFFYATARWFHEQIFLKQYELFR